MVEINTIVKWLVVAAVAAVASTLTFFSKFGTPLIRGLVMVGIGLALTYFLRGKDVAMLKYVAGGLMVAGGIVLANEYLVPSFKKVTSA